MVDYFYVITSMLNCEATSKNYDMKPYPTNFYVNELSKSSSYIKIFPVVIAESYREVCIHRYPGEKIYETTPVRSKLYVAMFSPQVFSVNILFLNMRKRAKSQPFGNTFWSNGCLMHGET